MNIWIDLTNSPHIHFFRKMISEMQTDHNVLLTCRPLGNTIELLDLYQLRYSVIGKHYGRSNVKKASGFPLRIIQLYRFLRSKSIDVAISHSSFYSPLVAKMIGARCFYMNDNEHATGNRISFVFADWILVPEFLDERKVQQQWGKSHKVIKYPGLKEGIYLWNYEGRMINRNTNVAKRHSKTIYIRPEPLTAQYYKGRKNFMDDLLLELQALDSIRITMLPRTQDQEKYYQQEKFKHIYIPKKSIPLTEIVESCDLFIGAGGTMTRETAVLGIPTISIYQDKLLDVDRYLIDNGCMLHRQQISAKFALNYLAQIENKAPNSILLQKGKSAYHFIKNLVLNHSDPSAYVSPVNSFPMG